MTKLILFASLFCAVRASAVVSAARVAHYLNMASGPSDYIQMIVAEDQARYLHELVRSGHVAADFKMKASVTAPNTLVLRGNWGQLAFDFARSTDKKLWINGEAFDVKDYYELGDLRPRRSALAAVVPRAFAADGSGGSGGGTGAGFPSVIGASVYSGYRAMNDWANDNSAELISHYPMLREFRCDGSAFVGFRYGVDNNDYKLSRASNGTVRAVDFAQAFKSRCHYAVNASSHLTDFKPAHAMADCALGERNGQMDSVSDLLSFFHYKKDGEDPLKKLDECCGSSICKSKMADVGRQNSARYAWGDNFERANPGSLQPAPRLGGGSSHAQ